MTKKSLTKTILLYESIGFGIVILFLWADEVFDLPHHILGAPATPINWLESALESTLTLGLGIFTIILTWNLLKRIKYLEGFVPVCLFCKRVRVNDQWMDMETYIIEHSEAEITHSLCPDCAEKYYGEFRSKDAK